MPHPSKLVLCVIDAMAPQMLERAVEGGEAPVLGALMQRGSYIPDCVAAFPSVTPVCAASIVTGAWQDRHLIPAMNWYHRVEGRYIEYGSSFRAAQRFGIARQLTDTVYNMNRVHLATEPLTIFESLDDAEVRTAGTTYLMYRGRHRHEPQRDSPLTRLASTLMRHSVEGPRELFYADIFASRRTGCTSGLGMPGVRDQHSGCVGAYLVEHDLFDFLLLSLPDNDWYSHKHGPEGQVRSLALADQQLARMMDAGGGMERFLDEHAVIVMADHSQVPITHAIALQDQLEDLEVLTPTRLSARSSGSRDAARIAVCPSQRAAMVYLLSEHRREELRSDVTRRALQLDGVDLVMWMERGQGADSTWAVIAKPSQGELRFAPGGDLRDERGGRWSVEGDLAVIAADVHDGVLRAVEYPDALTRVWSALQCPTSGDVLLSASEGYEFSDWGRQAHVGGGSHGSLHRSDSLGALILCGLEFERPTTPWAIRDVAPVIAGHFGLPSAPS
ncbi:MAG TPA: alkaline phosphatase family protein [Solirubrobacteraceae bacterium]